VKGKKGGGEDEEETGRSPVREKSLGSQADMLNPSPVPRRATSPLPPHRDFLPVDGEFPST
jgi:hypothetical protein